MGWRERGCMAKRDRRGRHRNQPRRAQRQLSLHRCESTGNPPLADCVDARDRRGDRPCQAAAACVAPSKHRDDLCTSIRWRQRRTVRRARRRRIERTEFMAVQYRRRASVGAGLRRSRYHGDAKGYAQVGDDAQSGCGRSVRYAARTRTLRPRRHRWQRPPIHLLDSLRGFRSGRALADRPRGRRRHRERRIAQSPAKRRFHAPAS